MSDRYFVDTNILLYAHDRLAGVKYTRAKRLIEHLWHSQQGVLSTQVLQEFCANARKKLTHAISADELKAIVEDYLNWNVVVNSPRSILKVLELEDRYRISFWDALILQAAEEAGASMLYSEELNNGEYYGSVQVINPLTDSFHLPS